MKEKIKGEVEIPEELRELAEEVTPLFLDEFNLSRSLEQSRPAIQLPSFEPLPPPLDAEVTPTTGRNHLTTKRVITYPAMYDFHNPFKDEES